MDSRRIVTLGDVVIPPENTPRKETSQSLVANPRWQYIGPSDAIRLEWQIGRWTGTFDGIGPRKYKDFSQPASNVLSEFSTNLPSIPLSSLAPSDDPYDCEIVFKDGFSDLRVIVENCVLITGPVTPPPSDIADWDFVPVAGEYERGNTVPFSASYKYKGKAQGGYLTISLGTGPVGTFFTKYTYPKLGLTFDESMDWNPEYLNGTFTLPSSLEVGQTYSVQAKIETLDGKQETDRDWTIITIVEEGNGGPPPPPPPEGEFDELQLLGLPKSAWMGSYLNFTTMFKYRGPAYSARVYVAVGAVGIFGFDEYIDGQTTKALSASANWRTQLVNVRVDVESPIRPGVYDVYFKVDGEISQYYHDQITITE